MKSRMLKKVLAALVVSSMMMSFTTIANARENSVPLRVNPSLTQELQNSPLSFTISKSKELVPLYAEEYKQCNTVNGYGLAGKAGVSVTLGASAEIDVSARVRCITQENLVSFIQSNKSNFTNEQYSTITEHSSYKNNSFGSRLFCGLLGVKFGNGSWDYYKNASNKQTVASDSKQESLLRQLHDMSQHDYTLTGKLKAVGKSYIPTVAYVFIEVTRIQFQDGTTLKVLNTNGVIADSNGERDDVGDDPSNEPLHLIPLD